MAGIDRYLRRDMKRVEGWLDPLTARIIAALGRHQTAGGLSGAVGEIGVHHGKLWLVLDHVAARLPPFLALAPRRRPTPYARPVVLRLRFESALPGFCGGQNVAGCPGQPWDEPGHDECVDGVGGLGWAVRPRPSTGSGRGLRMCLVPRAARKARQSKDEGTGGREGRKKAFI